MFLPSTSRAAVLLLGAVLLCSAVTMVNAVSCGTLTYGLTDTTGLSNVTWSTDTLYLSRIFISFDATINCLGEYVRANPSGCVAKYVLYVETSGNPATVVGSTATVNNTQAGFITAPLTASVFVTKGMYWVGAHYSGSCLGMSLTMTSGSYMYTVPLTFGTAFPTNPYTTGSGAYIRAPRYVVTATVGGGLAHAKVGYGIHTVLTGLGSSATGGWMGSGTSFASGMDNSNGPAPITGPYLDTTVWRLGGVSGPTGSTMCAISVKSGSASPCSTTWNAVQGLDLSAVSPSPMGQHFATWADFKTTFSSVSAVSTWQNTLYGGIKSVDAAPAIWLMPHVRNTTGNDLAEGYLDLRLVNRMNQYINSLAVRFSLQCYNLYATSTTVKLQYTHMGGDDWFFANAGPSFTSPAACTAGTECTCTSLTDCVYNYNGRVELTGLHWGAAEQFYLRWYVTSSATLTGATFSDAARSEPCRLLDIETIPFVQEMGDTSVELRLPGQGFIDVRARTDPAHPALFLNWRNNFTISMWARPNSLTDADGGMPRTAHANDLVLFSAWDPLNTVEFNFVIRPTSSWVVAMAQNLTNGSGSSTPSYYFTTTTGVDPDGWTHIAYVHTVTKLNESNEMIFFNGVVQLNTTVGLAGFKAPLFGGPSVPNNTTVNTSSVFRVGSRAWPNATSPQTFVGHLDEFRVYNTSKSPTDVFRELDFAAPLNAPNLVVYFQFNNSITLPTLFAPLNPAIIPDSSTTGIFVGIVGGVSSPSLSPITPLAVAGLSGGSITCERHQTTPTATIQCNMTIMNDFGGAQSSFDTGRFTVALLEGDGIVTQPTPDASGYVWYFSYTAGNFTGTSRIQAYSHGNAFAGVPWYFNVISEVCQACDFREERGGQKFYTCVVRGRRFIRANIQNTPGICPMY